MSNRSNTYPSNDPNQGPPGYTPGPLGNGKPYYANPSHPNQSGAPDLDIEGEATIGITTIEDANRAIGAFGRMGK